MSHTVLVVDDSSIVRLQVSSALKRRDYAVVQASSAEEAMEIVRGRQDIDLIITDVNMPGMSGLALLSGIRGLDGYKNTPIFVLTTESTGHMQEQGQAKGATAWIVKPFNETALMDGIKKILG